MWGSCGIALGLLVAWGAGVWWLTHKDEEVLSREIRLVSLEAKNSALGEVNRAARTLLAETHGATAMWFHPEAPAITLIEEIEQLAQQAEVAWETKSAREAPPDAAKPSVIIINAEFTGTRDSIGRLLRSLDGVAGRPHPTSLTLEITEDSLWRGVISLQAFRAPTFQEASPKEEVAAPYENQ